MIMNEMIGICFWGPRDDPSAEPTGISAGSCAGRLRQPLTPYPCTRVECPAHQPWVSRQEWGTPISHGWAPGGPHPEVSQDLLDHLGVFDENEKNTGHDANPHDREGVMLPDLRVGRMARTPLPLSAARTRPAGSLEAARRPDGTTTMGHERFPGRGLGDRRQRTRSRGGQPPAS